LVVLFEDLRMHGTTTNHKFINAKQAGDIRTYKNIKQKLHKTIAANWFNEACRERNLKPNYINITKHVHLGFYTETGDCDCSLKVLLMIVNLLPETR
jgi:hypothetical protein